MKSHDFLNENIVDDAATMHQDHEVQMARKECYHSAENAIKIHQLLQQISETQGLEGWVAAKITLASDYLTTVREYLEYQQISDASNDITDVIAFSESQEQLDEISDKLARSAAKGRWEKTVASVGAAKETPTKDTVAQATTDVTKAKKHKELQAKRTARKQQGVAEGVTPASVSKVLRLIQRHHSDWFDTYGLGEVEDTVVDMAEMDRFHGMSAEDATALVGQELESLYGQQGVAEAYEEYDDIDDDDEEENDGFYVVIASEDSGVFIGALTKDGGRWRETTVKGNAPYNWGGGYMSYLTPEEVMRWIHKDYDRSYEVAGPFYDDQDVEDYANSLMENSAGCVAGVVNANGMKKPKKQIGSLFGGTYKQKKA